MTEIKLIYNPYLLKTKLFIENAAVTSNSSLAFVFGKIMQKWLEPSGAWRGFFAELVGAVGLDRLEISFIGTAQDFDDLKAATRPKNIELEYLLKKDAEIRAGARPKLQALVDFLDAPFEAEKDFLAKIRPALKDTLSDKNTLNVVSIVKNFSVQNILPKVADGLNLVVNESNQNLMFTLLKALADVNKSMTLFVFDCKTISSEKVTEALCAVTQALGQDEYAQAIYESLFFVCVDCADGSDIENILNACGFGGSKLFMVNSAFADRREILSASDCKNFLSAPISSTLKVHYANRIAHCREVIKECAETLKFYALHTPDEIEDAERSREEALNEIALINSNLPALEQTVLYYSERYLLPNTVRKIYLGVKKKLAAVERDTDKKLFDTNESLRRLHNRIADLKRKPAQENPPEEVFDAANVAHFDSKKFEELSCKLLNRLTVIEVPAAENAVEKNLVGHTADYLKLTDANGYLQTVNAFLKNFLSELIEEATAHLDARLLTSLPVSNEIT